MKFFSLLSLVPTLTLSLCAPAFANWEVRTDFELHLAESLFDKMIGDFWSTLNGKQSVPIGDFTIAPAGIPIQIRGVRADVTYDFPVPERVPGNVREWSLASNSIGGRLTVASVNATQVITREIDGIIVTIQLNAECHNIALSLPPDAAKVSAKIRAEVAQSKVKLSFNDFLADWKPGAWKLDSIECTGDVEGLKDLVRVEALKALQSFQNFDADVHTALLAQFNEWSKNASLLLLTENELPTGKDYLRIFYEPSSAVETNKGLLLKGLLRFEYPYVAPGQEISQTFHLENSDGNYSNLNEPMLLLPFQTIRSLFMGEYFSGKLEYSLKAKEIPAFQDLMNSYFKKLFGWPDLLKHEKDTPFVFQFLPMGPPSFENEKNGGNNAIAGNMNLPLAVRMFAPVKGVYRPYVEFRTMLSGESNLTLMPEGKVSVQVKTDKVPLTYAWSKSYLSEFNPSTKIAVDKMGDAIKESLNAEGFLVGMPAITVGKSLELKPKEWKLENGNLRLNFTTGN